MNNTNKLQELLYDKMVQRGFSMRALAREAGVNQTVLWHLLKGNTRTVQDKTLKKLADALDLSYATLKSIESSYRSGTMIVRSSHGNFSFSLSTGDVLDIDLDDDFGPFPTDVDVKSIPPEYLKFGEVDVLRVGFFYNDEHGVRRYEQPLTENEFRGHQ